MLPKARLRLAKGGSSALLIKPMRSLNLSGAKAKRETAEPFINDYILASLNSFQKQTTKPQGGENIYSQQVTNCSNRVERNAAHFAQLEGSINAARVL